MKAFASPDVDEPRPPGATKPKPKVEPKKKAETDETEPGETNEEETAQGEEGKPSESKTVEEEKPAESKAAKTSPWKVADHFKKKSAALELRVAELEAAAKPGELPKEAQEKFTSLETRNKELEEEIRFVNYSKSKDYIEQYQKPYEEAWRSAIEDLKELSVANEDGTNRVATAQDMMALANMPLGQARATAKAWFGDSADDIMAHRRTLRELSDKQTKALDDAKKNGSEREQQRQAEMQAKHKARSEETSKLWGAINAEAQEKYEYLRPVEGQTERNERLEKAVKFVDETFSKNIGQAKTQEERDQILRAHAALRNRAIGFSVLKHENKTLKAELAELKKSLEQFQGSEPTAGDRRDGSGDESSGGTLDDAVRDLGRLAT